MSSANVVTRPSPLDVIRAITDVYMLNRTGDSKDPCGNPGHICVGSEVHPSNIKATILSINDAPIHLTNHGSTPQDSKLFLNYIANFVFHDVPFCCLGFV